MKINYSNIIENLKYLETKYHKNVILIIKNNAYNTGIQSCVKACFDAGFKYFALTNVEEGILAKKACPDAYVLVMNPTTAKEIKQANEYGIVLSITSLKWYQENFDILKDTKLHLKINIGMNRFGLSNIDEINELINTNKNIEGLLTHFPVSDIDDLTIHNQQVNNFVEMFNQIENKEQLKIVHSENSATLMLEDPRLSFCNYARVGIIGYGYSPTEFDENLKPSIYLNTKVIDIHTVKKGEYIGYGLSNKMAKDTKVAICPLGYGEGLSKLRSNLPVIINGKEYEIIVISMSHMVLEIDDDVKLDDDVEIYGDNVRIDHLLQVCDTTCSIHMASLHTNSH